jgi:hypothetical protein
MSSLLWAKVASVLSVLYAGANLYQLFAKLEDVRQRAKQFSAVAGNAEHSGRLRVVRALFYLGAPLAYLAALLASGLPAAFLAVAGVKFWVSAIFGLATEQRLLRGEEYRVRDHRFSRIDALLNLALAGTAVFFLLTGAY